MKSKAKTFAKTGIDFIRSYQSLAVMAVYAVFYLAAFFYLEQRNISYHVINFGLDQYIPFCEIFIVPYLLWFAYVALTVVFLGIKDKEEADKLVKFFNCRNDNIYCDISGISQWSSSAADNL